MTNLLIYAFITAVFIFAGIKFLIWKNNRDWLRDKEIEKQIREERESTPGFNFNDGHPFIDVFNEYPENSLQYKSITMYTNQEQGFIKFICIKKICECIDKDFFKKYKDYIINFSICSHGRAEVEIVAPDHARIVGFYSYKMTNY